MFEWKGTKDNFAIHAICEAHCLVNKIYCTQGSVYYLKDQVYVIFEHPGFI